jgi:RNA polymerase sigma-70 factor (ECF subfamily)
VNQQLVDRIYERLLVLRCQAGDEEAFAQIVARYQPRLRAFLVPMLNGDAHAAADAAQDVWLDVYRHVGDLKDTAAFPAWLYRIARDRAYRMLRRKRLIVAQDVPEMTKAGAEEFDDDERAMVNESLDRLPHEQREVLLLRFIEDLSYEQIADATGCAIGTVRSRLHYAKLALRRMICERNDRYER